MTNQPADWGVPNQDPDGETNPTKPIPNPYGPAPWQRVTQPDPVYGSAYPAQKTNGMAITSLVLSISTLFCGFTAILGIICGHIALSQINRSGEHGRGLAVAGLVIGYVFVVLFLVFIVILFLLSAASASA
jgi:uncharacterized BrkB/YihY/UPF0761 family membrane protein